MRGQNRLRLFGLVLCQAILLSCDLAAARTSATYKLPRPSSDLLATSVSGYIFFIGGNGGGVFNDFVYGFDPVRNDVRIGSLSVARNVLAASVTSENKVKSYLQCLRTYFGSISDESFISSM